MKVLVFAPHADDETLGMGGTISLLREKGNKVIVAIMTGHGEKKHPLWESKHWDEIRSEARKAAKVLNISQLIFRELPAACLDNIPSWEINKEVNLLIKEIQPNEIYIPYADDLHKDHYAISYAVIVASRPYLDISKSIRRILSYETLSETGLNFLNPNNSFNPNVYVNISSVLNKKIEAMKKYKSQLQHSNQPRSIDNIKALAKIRGGTIGCEAAEAFVLLGEYNR